MAYFKNSQELFQELAGVPSHRSSIESRHFQMIARHPYRELGPSIVGNGPVQQGLARGLFKCSGTLMKLTCLYLTAWLHL